MMMFLMRLMSSTRFVRSAFFWKGIATRAARQCWWLRTIAHGDVIRLDREIKSGHEQVKSDVELGLSLSSPAESRELGAVRGAEPATTAGNR